MASPMSKKDAELISAELQMLRGQLELLESEKVQSQTVNEQLFQVRLLPNPTIHMSYANYSHASHQTPIALVLTCHRCAGDGVAEGGSGHHERDVCDQGRHP
jgi:hypothetical protein